ncbi:NADP-dependent 3-hydroxy acid dehydrogenase YdfG [Fusobacterium sp. DD29]|uniref:SDR family NAD(P)-dependent oxidoreductase n=1 Tax=unclassified Fusobacterium TaxID=2648384 RepID=UPI001B8CB688|nr:MULTISPECIES: SDR family NAD(P)-dependent oxidoreductase [unclassified Fusobacterium]MBR8701320.1 NADP-dependent 3-hydroxy acid dehydrogenase YdfG [Fusobacterium sp. DD45]MBR8711064.1 NADP-dependent 3-hydroxy acid dehydrogenase YdfG [Fusobacterium sp. DD28]MBR8749448.1 NADP-dependent 3-hydroxy acid dehydrogenase YdfG [Fusobacterium sp. DD29]MBR8751638.1 NADP-dependent 3-hydroxy acid dehydrogenase YdfG [Fusobacterium sp. DD26]MBR8761662.1 NADP-dependent 3-hydroxy acid dehydrogenase YdfG [Fus
MVNENRLKGKIAFITGATSGIGRSCAVKLAEFGMNLIIAARRESVLNELKEKLEKEHKIKVYVMPLDVRDSKAVVEKINGLLEEWKAIDILVNNAGLAFGLDKLYLNSNEDIDTVFDTNVKGMLYVNNAVVPLMLKRDVPCTIINMGSVAGDAAYAGGAVYCASKAAIKTLSDGLRIDLVDTKIKVTDIKPGLVETNFSMIRFKGDKERAEKVYKGIEPLTPDDIADSVAYVANLPANVHIAEMTIVCANQADGRVVHRHN